MLKLGRIIYSIIYFSLIYFVGSRNWSAFVFYYKALEVCFVLAHANKPYPISFDGIEPFCSMMDMKLSAITSKEKQSFFERLLGKLTKIKQKSEIKIIVKTNMSRVNLSGILF